MKTIRNLLAIIALMASSAATAGTPTKGLADVALKIQTECPVDISRGWVVQTIDFDDKAVTITMVIDTTPENLAKMKGNLAELKKNFLHGFAKKANQPGTLIAETIASKLPLVVDIINADGVDTISITFSPEELSKTT